MERSHDHKPKRKASSPIRRQRLSGARPALRSIAKETEFADLRARLGVSRGIFARLVGVSERSLADWETGRKPASAAALRALRQARTIYDTALKVMKADFVGTWLQQPSAGFGGLKPLEVIERGEHERVWRVLFALESGGDA